MSYTPTVLGKQILGSLPANNLTRINKLLTDFNNSQVLIENKDLRAIVGLRLTNTGFSNGNRYYSLKPEYFVWEN
jgi:hypothetical protein